MATIFQCILASAVLTRLASMPTHQLHRRHIDFHVSSSTGSQQDLTMAFLSSDNLNSRNVEPVSYLMFKGTCLGVKN